MTFFVSSATSTLERGPRGAQGGVGPTIPPDLFAQIQQAIRLQFGYAPSLDLLSSSAFTQGYIDRMEGRPWREDIGGELSCIEYEWGRQHCAGGGVMLPDSLRKAIAAGDIA